MKKLLLLLPFVLVLLSTSTVFASGKPERVFAPIPQPIVVSGSCAFDVDVSVVKNNEYFINFYDANGNLVRQLVGGSLVITLPGASAAQADHAPPGAVCEVCHRALPVPTAKISRRPSAF